MNIGRTMDKVKSANRFMTFSFILVSRRDHPFPYRGVHHAGTAMPKRLTYLPVAGSGVFWLLLASETSPPFPSFLEKKHPQNRLDLLPWPWGPSFQIHPTRIGCPACFEMPSLP